MTASTAVKFQIRQPKALRKVGARSLNPKETAMFDPNPVRQRCRNPRCKARLKEPAENPRDAFCCAGCEAGFYRTHCRVCEKELGDAKRNSRRELCGKRKCTNEFRSDRKRAQLFSRYYPLAATSKPGKSSTKSTLITGTKADLGFAIGADYDREVLRANFRANAAFWNDAALIGPTDPPVNILGGYKFPNAPVVDLNPILPKTEKQKFSPEQQKRFAELLAQIPDDLSIPAFLRRRPL